MTSFVYSWSRCYAAMAIMVYALITYHWRAASIRRRDTGPYDDRLGPVSNSLGNIQYTHSLTLPPSMQTILCIFLLGKLSIYSQYTRSSRAIIESLSCLTAAILVNFVLRFAYS